MSRDDLAIIKVAATSLLLQRGCPLHRLDDALRKLPPRHAVPESLIDIVVDIDLAIAELDET